MYLYQPCLLTMVLYAWGFAQTDGKRRWLRVSAPLVVLALSEWELFYTQIWFYPAAMLLPLIYLFGRIRTLAWAEVLTASVLGGLLCWKAADRWPLFLGLPLLCAALLLIPIMLLCQKRDDRFLACALGGLLFELFFCLREHMLFSFCVVRLGSREGLSLSASSICLCAIWEQAHLAVSAGRKPAVPIGN